MNKQVPATDLAVFLTVCLFIAVAAAAVLISVNYNYGFLQ